jgi:hypothetical protein
MNINNLDAHWYITLQPAVASPWDAAGLIRLAELALLRAAQPNRPTRAAVAQVS